MILFLHNRYRTTGGEERVVEDLLWLVREHLGGRNALGQRVRYVDLAGREPPGMQRLHQVQAPARRLAEGEAGVERVLEQLRTVMGARPFDVDPAALRTFADALPAYSGAWSPRSPPGLRRSG